MRTKLAIVAVAAALALVSTGSLDGQPEGSPQVGNEIVPPELFGDLRYRMVGPSRGGRVTAVAGHRARPGTFYMGATGGGVWKTEDYGRTWRPVSDGYLATGSVGAIGVAESDPDIVYVSTGSDGLRSNVIVGKGVYRSIDGGDSWRYLGLGDTGNSGAVLVHPRNPDVAYVAAIGDPFAPNPERGVYRTRDGGNTWDKVLFISERTGVVDLEFAPDDPETVYAAAWQAERKPWTIISGGEEGGVFKSSDGGATWKRLTDGLPTGLVGKADLAVTAGDPDRVYVLIEAPDDEGGVYRSDDRGETWGRVTGFRPIRTRPFYYTNLHAHPSDPDVLWGMTEGHWKSTDGGRTWGREQTPHADNHDLWINPDHPEIMIQSNDGGANVSRDGGRTWSTQQNQPTAELYQVDLDDGFPYRLYAGQQDNSTISVPSFPPRSVPGGYSALWESHGGCETGPVVPKPGDPDVVYANCKGRFGLYNRRTGQEQQHYVWFGNLYGHNPKDLPYRFQRVAPVHVSPHDPNRVYHGSQYVHVTEDGGQTWETISPDLTAFTPETQVVSGGPITPDVTGEEHFAVLYEIQESPHEAGVIWAGANDGPIHLTRNDGATWIDVTPLALGPYGRVQTIEVSPHDPAKAYVAVLRYQVGDYEPYAFKTTDYGGHWTRITTGDNGIPADHPVRVVREDPGREGLLYAGTEFGIFISFDDGENWQPFQLNLPVTPVTDIKVHRRDLVLSTMGRSFWILSDVTRLHALSPRVAERPVHLFETREAFRLRRAFGGSDPSQPARPEYAPVGAYVDYWLAEEPAGEVTLEVRDSDGDVVRIFSSGPPGERPVPAGERGAMEWRLEAVGTRRLPKSAGAHRFVWDLTHPGPWHPDPSRSGRGGPMVPPGRYQARLSVGDRIDTTTFWVRMDPRVREEGITDADVTAQSQLALEARNLLGNARLIAQRVRRALGMADLEGSRRALEELRQELETSTAIRYARPMLVDQIQYLYDNLTRADQRPGDFAYRRYEELRARLEEIVGELDRLLGSQR